MIEAAESRIRAVETDRPRLHIHPEHGWLNDPNGLCRIDGIYHVFYQHNPAGPLHGDIHWAHVSSTDLLHWRPEPVALIPRPREVDGGGCWSGCIVDDGGVPTAVYTGVRTGAQDAGLTLARSDRTLRDWTGETEWRADIPDDPAIAEVRDPFVFWFEGHRYAVQGAGHPSGAPQLLCYSCDDLEQWTRLDSLLTAADPIAASVASANIWECPNLFQLEGRWVLLLSLWRLVDGSSQLSGVRYLLGDLTLGRGTGPRFTATSGGSLDCGPTFYAPQVLVEPDRVLLWGWAWEGPERSAAEITAAGWSGTLTSPRELLIRDDAVVCRPAAEMVRLRRESIDYRPGTTLELSAFEISAQDGLRLQLTNVEGRVRTVAESAGQLRLLVDGSLVELYGSGPTYTTRAYLGAGERWVIDSAGPLTVWRLGLDD